MKSTANQMMAACAVVAWALVLVVLAAQAVGGTENSATNAAPAPRVEPKFNYAMKPQLAGNNSICARDRHWSRTHANATYDPADQPFALEVLTRHDRLQINQVPVSRTALRGSRHASLSCRMLFSYNLPAAFPNAATQARTSVQGYRLRT